MRHLSILCMFFSSICFSPALSAKEKAPPDDKYVENDVVSLAGKKGFVWSTPSGDFLFKPYALMQAAARLNYYDDQGLELIDSDNIANTGFALPHAILGFTGKAFDRVSFNLSINAAQSGGALLQQAWFDVAVSDELRFRVGKFKTPTNYAFLSTIGETLFPLLPTSLTTPVHIPYSLNAVNPQFATGFDLGIQMHGVLNDQWAYQLGLFNGTGIGVNQATKTMSDDIPWLPSLLYAARVAYLPLGALPNTQGNPDFLTERKLQFAVSASYNVEAQSESSNDFRAGFEFVWMQERFYLAAEAYFMNMKFAERQYISEAYNFWGAYAHAGYFITDRVQLAARYDLYDCNGMERGGLLNVPGVGFNYFFYGSNLKLQTMYQHLGRVGHESQIQRDNDALGLPRHAATTQLQYTF